VFKDQLKEEPTLPGKLAKYAAQGAGGMAIPGSGLAIGILIKVAETLFDKPATMERVKDFFDLVVEEFKGLETTKASHEDVWRAVLLGIWYDRHERDDAKRERYVKLIGNAVRSEKQVQDITSFIKTLEQLNERGFEGAKGAQHRHEQGRRLEAASESRCRQHHEAQPIDPDKPRPRACGAGRNSA